MNKANSRGMLTIILLGAVLYLAGFAVGCAKEYSYEGGPPPDTAAVPDPIGLPDTTGTLPPPPVAGCNSCAITDTSSASKWRFEVDGRQVCGFVTRAVLSPDADAMTFFGPSSCSRDSGLIITAYFQNQSLKEDQTNLTATQAELEYYDNTTLTDFLQSRSTHPFTVTIYQYSSQTGQATGHFSGRVVDKAGNPVEVTSGSFIIQF